MRTRAAPTAVAGRVAVPAAVAALFAVAAPPAAAQSGQEVDAGRFDIRVGGEHAAVESFAVRRDASGHRSASRVSFVPGVASAAFATLEARLQTTEALEPAFFELRYRNGNARTAVGARAGNRIQLRIRTERGERWQELLVEPGLVVVPEDVAHPYHLVVRTLQEHGEALQALRPFRGEMEPLTITGRSPEQLSVGGTPVAATRYDLRIGTDLHRVWADSAHRVLRVEVPDRDWTAVRQSAPGAGSGTAAGDPRPPADGAAGRAGDGPGIRSLPRRGGP